MYLLRILRVRTSVSVSVLMSWHAGKLLEQEVVDALTPGHETNRQLQLVLGLMSEHEIEMCEDHF